MELQPLVRSIFRKMIPIIINRDMKKFNILIVVVIALTVVNGVLIGLLWFANYHKKQPQGGQAFEYLTKQLQLTPAQVKQYTILRDEHAAFTHGLNEEIRMLRDTFFHNIKAPAIDSLQVKQLEQHIAGDQVKLDSATLYHFRKFRAILQPGQQNKFDGLIQQVLRMMGGPHPPQGRPGPDSGPPQGPMGGPPPDGPLQGGPPDGPPR